MNLHENPANLWKSMKIYENMDSSRDFSTGNKLFLSVAHVPRTPVAPDPGNTTKLLKLMPILKNQKNQ